MKRGSFVHPWLILGVLSSLLLLASWPRVWAGAPVPEPGPRLEPGPRGPLRPPRGERPPRRGGREPAPPRAPTPPAPETAPALDIVRHADGTLSVFAVNVGIQEFFVELGRAAGVPVIVDDPAKIVRRRITVNLTHKTLEEILASLATAYGISCSQVNGFYIVSEGIPTKPSSYLVSDIAAIRTQYVLAPQAKALLPLFLQDHVKVNLEQNAVIFSAPREVLEKFRQDIAQFDIPAAQIMFEILVVELTDISQEEFEATLNLQNEGRGVRILSGLSELTFHGLAELPKDFTYRLKALVTARKARVRANPTIATVSGQRAELFIGIKRFLRQPVQVGEGRFAEQVNFIEAGVRLILTPYTGGEGEIIVDLSPREEGLSGVEISTLSAPDPVTGLPEKSTRTANTIVLVHDGETIIIGGLLQTELRETRSKIPILGDIPLLGEFFRSSHLEETQTELVIFITPRILSQTGHLPPEEEAQLRRRFLEETAP